MANQIYTPAYYDTILSDSDRSAREVAPLIVKLLSPQSLIDVGCGCGTWTRAYKEAGVPEVLGVDCGEARMDQLFISPQEFRRHDLTKPLELDRRFDAVNSLEVAEHLPAQRADGFIADLCRLGDVVVFSAAVPGQGGTHHVNEQWPSYWIARFEKNGFTAFDCLRPQIWQNANVAWWYRQNMFIFIKRDQLTRYPQVPELARQPFPTDVAHPRAYETATVPQEMSPRMVKHVLQGLPHFPAKVWTHMRKGRSGQGGKD